MAEIASETLPAVTPSGESACAYRVLRYTPNLARDEWVNIGILLFNPKTGERRLRLIEDEEEYRRVRRLHPQADLRSRRLAVIFCRPRWSAWQPRTRALLLFAGFPPGAPLGAH